MAYFVTMRSIVLLFAWLVMLVQVVQQEQAAVVLAAPGDVVVSPARPSRVQNNNNVMNMLSTSLLTDRAQRRLDANNIGTKASNVYTTYNIYNAAQNGYSLSGLYCATWGDGKSKEYLSQYPWTAFCGPAGKGNVCFQCLRVTNQDTQARVTVRIVDRCSNGGLDLDQPAFQRIDTDNKGYQMGHMITTYEFVAC